MKALAGEPTPLEAVHVYTPASSWDDHDVHGNDDGDDDDVHGNDDGDDDDVHGNDDGDDDEDNDRTNTLPMEGTTSSRVCKVVSPLGKKPSWKRHLRSGQKILKSQNLNIKCFTIGQKVVLKRHLCSGQNSKKNSWHGHEHNYPQTNDNDNSVNSVGLNKK